MMIDRSEGESPASRNTAPIASSTACSGACGLVRILALYRRPAVSSATSVKVPPISTPSLPPSATAPSLGRPAKPQSLAAAEVGVNPLHRSGGGASEEGRHRCAASGHAGFTPTLFQASATAFCSVLVAPHRRLALV